MPLHFRRQITLQEMREGAHNEELAAKVARNRTKVPASHQDTHEAEKEFQRMYHCPQCERYYTAQGGEIRVQSAPNLNVGNTTVRAKERICSRRCAAAENGIRRARGDKAIEFTGLPSDQPR
jgi:hypothetical protein